MAEREGASAADAAESRLEAGHPAEGSRNADGPPSVRPERKGAQTRGQRGCRASTRTARDPVRIPRVAHGAVVGIGARDAVGQLVQPRLADQDRPCRVQSLDCGGVLFGDDVGKQGRAHGGRQTLGVEEVLRSVGNTVQRSPGPVCADLGLGLRGLGQRGVGCHGQVGIDDWVDALNAVKAMPHDLDGRRVAGSVQRADVAHSEPIGEFHQVQRTALPEFATS